MAPGLGTTGWILRDSEQLAVSLFGPQPEVRMRRADQPLGARPREPWSSDPEVGDAVQERPELQGHVSTALLRHRSRIDATLDGGDQAAKGLSPGVVVRVGSFTVAPGQAGGVLSARTR